MTALKRISVKYFLREWGLCCPVWWGGLHWFFLWNLDSSGFLCLASLVFTLKC